MRSKINDSLILPTGQNEKIGDEKFGLKHAKRFEKAIETFFEQINLIFFSFWWLFYKRPRVSHCRFM